LADKGFVIHLHEDFLMRHPLFAKIKKYNFFDYEIHEALHLLPRGKEILWSLYHKMKKEYHGNRQIVKTPESRSAGVWHKKESGNLGFFG